MYDKVSTEGSSFADPEGALIAAARDGDPEAFRHLTEPYRREIQLHCYRMMGSLHDAEDLTQEALFRAWRRLDSFERRSSFRAWLYRVATNACLTALDHRRRQPAAPERARHNGNGVHPDSVPNLEPFPDLLLDGLERLEDGGAGPEARYELRESVSLAFQVAIQLLPPRQRAALILGDVLGFSARETAELMGSTVAAVNSALQRARSTVGENGRRRAHASAGAGTERRLVERFVDAWERNDVDALVGLLTDGAVLTMPPDPLYLLGREAIGAFYSTEPAVGCLEQTRLVVTAANGQPALAAYLADPATGGYHAHAVMVLTVDGPAISALTGFPDPSLFAFFGLPATL